MSEVRCSLICQIPVQPGRTAQRAAAKSGAILSLSITISGRGPRAGVAERELARAGWQREPSP